ncbi:rhodanese-related sulfurtransferase [Candidatus Saccharibacteria bacterium]|nr:rhodanese-related sulfurtransferase [Candidatus Saccharibacteria bacterium]
MNLVVWLQEWYQSQCNGDWEHSHGLTIKTIDNPGCSIEVNLKGTVLESKSFEKIYVDNDEFNEEKDEDWYTCFVHDGVFEGVAGPQHLGTIIEIFKKLATEQ